jgi:hypothetical protein
MRNATTKSALLAAVMAVSLPGNNVTFADGGRYHSDWHDSGQHKQYQRWHHSERDHGSHVANYCAYDDDDNKKLLTGLAIGGLLGYAIFHAGYE